jgi:hypothetical protein
LNLGAPFPLLAYVSTCPQEKRDERKALERRAGLDDAEAKRALEAAKADAATARHRELETGRLVRAEEAARKEKAARAMEDTRWLQVGFPLEVANRMLAWNRGLTPEQSASVKARIAYLVRFGRSNTTVVAPFFWAEDTRFTSVLGNMSGVDRARHSVKSSKDFEWFLFNSSWASGSHNDTPHMLHRLWGRLVPDGHTLFQHRYTAQILLHDSQYVVEKAFIHGVWLLYHWLGPGWLPGGEFRWPPSRL